MANPNTTHASIETCVAAVLMFDTWQNDALLSQALFPDKQANKSKYSKVQKQFTQDILAIYNRNEEVNKFAQIEQEITNVSGKLKKQSNPYFSAFLKNLQKYIKNQEPRSNILATAQNYNSSEGIDLLQRQQRLSREIAPIVENFENLKTKTKLAPSDIEAINQTLTVLTKPLRLKPADLEKDNFFLKRSPDFVTLPMADNDFQEIKSMSIEESLNDQENFNFDNNDEMPMDPYAIPPEKLTTLINQATRHLKFLVAEKKTLSEQLKEIYAEHRDIDSQPQNLGNTALTQKIKTCIKLVNDYIAKIDTRFKATDKDKKIFAITIRASLVALLDPAQLQQFSNLTDLCNHINLIIHNKQLDLISPDKIGLFQEGKCGQMLKSLRHELIVEQEINEFVSDLFKDMERPVSELFAIKQQAESSLINCWRYYQYLEFYSNKHNFNAKDSYIQQEKTRLSNQFKSEYQNSLSIIETFFQDIKDVNDFFDINKIYKKNDSGNTDILIHLSMLANLKTIDTVSFVKYLQEHYFGSWIRSHFDKIMSEPQPDIFEATVCIQLLKKLEQLENRAGKIPGSNADYSSNIRNTQSAARPQSTPKHEPLRKTRSAGSSPLPSDLGAQNSLMMHAQKITPQYEKNYKLIVCSLNMKLKEHLPHPVRQGYGNLESIYAASIVQSQNGHILHFMSELPQERDRQNYINDCILVGNTLYRITSAQAAQKLSIDAGRLKDGIARLKRTVDGKITLTDKEFHSYIETRLTDEDSKNKLLKSRKSDLSSITQNQIKDDVSGKAYTAYINSKLQKLDPASAEKTLCDLWVSQKKAFDLNKFLSTEVTIDSFILAAAKTYSDPQEYKGAFFDYLHKKANDLKNSSESQAENIIIKQSIKQPDEALATRYAILAVYNDLKWSAKNHEIKLKNCFNLAEIADLKILRDFAMDGKLMKATAPLPSSAVKQDSPEKEDYILFSPLPPNQQQQEQAKARSEGIEKVQSCTDICNDLLAKNAVFHEKFSHYYEKAKANPATLKNEYKQAKKTSSLWIKITNINGELRALKTFFQQLLAKFSSKRQEEITAKETELGESLREQHNRFFYKKRDVPAQSDINIIDNQLTDDAFLST